ncbi:pentatricopeptide repeat-containing protein At5g39710-like [Rhodamnia argentea]|uniref:Pentatricopeptide repeat-containing protein At5g39710-like n=1 Tax=Rhodamnia argentea TaxID=178133 RepID=A0A8B8N6A1_9MYRT|nr:pentatricopeptide repeat-containing protein At5g39710-like [Rhodamnia argentea]
MLVLLAGGTVNTSLRIMPPHPSLLSSTPYPPPSPLLHLPPQRNPCSFRSIIISPRHLWKIQRRKLVTRFSPSRHSHGSVHRTSAILTPPSEVQGRENQERERRSCTVRVQCLAERIRALPATDRVEFVRLLRRDGQMGSLSGVNDLLAALAMAHEPDIALQVFDEMPSHGLDPDSWTFSSAIVCHCLKNNLDDAARILDFMVDNELCPSVATFTTLVNSFCRKGQMQRAFEVFRVMNRVGCEPTIQTYNCLIKGLCYVGRVEEAYEMLENIKKDSFSIKPDIYTYTAVMDGFCKVGRSPEAMELLDEALEAGLSPNVVTYNTLFNGYCKEGKPMKGFGVLKLMKESDCMPDNISYSTLIHGLLKWGKIRAALRAYKEMVGDGFEVEGRMLNTLLRAVRRISLKERNLLDDVYQMFEKMRSRGCVIDETSYGFIIQTLSVGNRDEEALFNIEHMMRMGHSPKMTSLARVVRALCGEGKLDKALLVLMDERFTHPIKDAYNVVINESNRQGRWLCACNVYGMALKRGVVPEKKPEDA